LEDNYAAAMCDRWAFRATTMADDGMLLNFTVQDNAIKSQPKFKGGSWKDRMIAKKLASHRRDRNARPHHMNNVAVQDNHAAERPRTGEKEFPDSRPTKRRRENGDFQPAGTREAALNPRPNLQDRPPTQHASRPREIISSLFSYNPRPSSVQDVPTEGADHASAQPSNAPLVDGIDTFTSLGLSPTLAAHLLTKMGLKTPTAIQKSSVTQLLMEDTDAFIQSETGSGKTLAYLLPLVQRIMALSGRRDDESENRNANVAVHRDTGLFAIILAPTRELCKQISVVLERLLGCARWIVAGTVIGGEKKKSEKARLRKGLNILVATPGRLADHLENTKVLDITTVRWLVLDEGDRLMDLGFEEEIQKIVRKLDEKQKDKGIPGLPKRRTNILCSATLKMNVQRLGEISLKDAALIKAEAANGEERSDAEIAPSKGTAFSAPAQLKQSYTIVAAKLRLVTLTALLQRTFARKGSVMKAIVFVSCADSVDFHFEAFTREPAGVATSKAVDTPPMNKPSQNQTTGQDPARPSPLLSTSANSLTLYKLHGSLPQATRTSIVKQFSSTTNPSLLIATDVASRGLDLPNLDLVIEYDPAFSSDDHIHRVGRTARLGRDGRALIFLMPGPEEGYVEVLKSSYKAAAEGAASVTHTPADELLKKGFSPSSGLVGPSRAWEQKATDFQLDLERWVLSDPRHGEIAKRAFQSHVRAYATHVAAERKWFDIKELHLGHLAKAFGLRDAPGRMNVPGMGGRGSKSKTAGVEKDGRKRKVGDGVSKVAAEKTTQADVAAKRMREKVRNRKVMMGAGVDEFNIA
jgi:ATP-dependent RNA helicase DDX31/DBP7